MDNNIKTHQQIGTEMDLFHFEPHSPAMLFWHPKGASIFNNLESFMRDVHVRRGYQEIKTPVLLNKSLWEKSGHWEKFRENMFIVDNNKHHDYISVSEPAHDLFRDVPFALKPMSCPAHIEIFKSGVRSYADLPLRYMEFGMVHRNEPSGAVLGMMRLRQFTQDDAHIFCTHEQILSEAINYIKAVKEVYNKFGFDDVKVKLATRPENRIGEDEDWDNAENSLENACSALDIKPEINKGEGAFYGPKLEFALQDCHGRDWQCGTIQVDFNLAKRLDAHYIDENNERKTPVILHHAILGSLERWIGIILEQDQGSLPFWLTPVQFVVTGISNKFDNDVRTIYHTLLNSLRDKGYNESNIIMDLSNERISKKILNYRSQKIPYCGIVGKKEIEKKSITIRDFKKGCENLFSIDDCIFLLIKEKT